MGADHGGKNIHDDEKDEGEENIDHQGQGRAGDEIPDVFEFSNACNGFTGSSRLKVGQR